MQISSGQWQTQILMTRSIPDDGARAPTRVLAWFMMAVLLPFVLLLRVAVLLASLSLIHI